MIFKTANRKIDKRKGLLLGFKSAAASDPENQKIFKGKLICQELRKVPQDVVKENVFSKE